MEYILSPGDVIYFGPNIVHSVAADVPRAGIGFQHKKDNQNNLELGDLNARS
jgi:quercetin dioxygenase-like cupin family protein